MAGVGRRRHKPGLRSARGRIAAWLALAGCLLQFLTPLAWAMARDADPLAGALAICTADGFRTLDASGKDVPAGQKAPRPFCPACATIAHGILPPQQEFAPAVLPRAADPVLPTQQRIADQRPARLNQVRAPPLA